MSTIEPNESTTSAAPKSRRHGRRAAIVGTIAGLALVGGAGAAYAASQQAPVETGYATVADVASPGANTNGAKGDCPDRAGGGQTAPGGSGSSGESASPAAPSSPTASSAPSSPEQTPGDI